MKAAPASPIARPEALGVAASLAVVLAAFLAGWLVSAAGVRWAGYDPLQAASWARRDSGHYGAIAEHGYVLTRCPVPPYRPGDWCGNAGFYPLYPTLIRALGWVGIATWPAGVLLSAVAGYGFLAVLWFGWLRRAPRLLGALALLLAALFPGMVFQRAVFPISLALLSMAAALLALRHRRHLLAGVLAVPGVLAYPTTIALAGVAVVLLVDPAHGIRPLQRARAAAAFLAPMAAGLLAVFAVYQVTVQHWNAFFLFIRKQGYGQTVPMSTWLEHHWDGFGHGANAQSAQALWVAAFAAAVTVVLVRRRFATADPVGDRLLLAALLSLWLVPALLGGGLSFARTEALLAVAAPLGARLPPAVLAAFVLSAAVIAVGLSLVFAIG